MKIETIKKQLAEMSDEELLERFDLYTDGYTDFPKEHPTYPVIWVIVGGSNVVPPFGSVIRLD